MTPTEMKSAGIRIYGRKGWKTRLALDLGVDESTIFRIMHREQVPPVYDVAIAGLLEHKRRQDVLDREARKLLPRKFRKRKAARKPKPVKAAPE